MTIAWTLTIFSVLVLGSAAFALIVGVVTFRERPDPLAVPITVLMVAIAIWALPHAISIGYTDVDHSLFWYQVSYSGIVIAPLVYFVIAVKYAGYQQWLSNRVYAGLAVIPALTLLFVWTNARHELVWESVTIISTNGGTVLQFEYGIWYWVMVGFLYLVTVTSLLILGSVMVRSGTAYRKQAALIFLGGVVPLGTNVLMQFGIGPDPMVDLTTTALTVSGAMFAIAIFQVDLMEFRPVAREWLVEELDDGMVVIGQNGRIRDFNRTASTLLGEISISQSLADVAGLEALLDGTENTLVTDMDDRRIRAHAVGLSDERGREIGQIIYLNDITAIAEREQRINVLNRILRHNIRNELTLITGHLELLESELTATGRQHLEIAQGGAQRILKLAEKARHIERTVQQEESLVTVSACTVAERVVTEAAIDHPAANITYNSLLGEADGRVRVIEEALFDMAITELVENAVTHNDRDPPTIVVRVDTQADTVRVIVEDNGPPIPAGEKDVLTAQESALEHGSGLGLWLVKWTVSMSAGEISFERVESGGNAVVLTLPAIEA